MITITFDGMFCYISQHLPPSGWGLSSKLQNISENENVNINPAYTLTKNQITIKFTISKW